ncbi:DUF6093 family protein [Streptomyces natalensis]|uniref:Uncharacterized protein n=1 Tax=Streptomyces natalensis ATCC 27448 TaxID=1240678 RepID=A0A0D7CL84_9ACTN|nr:DUF6093 family protein [Streptomyces natalensis]KIZ16836.1 hypothetical protein SNA_17710 [Streptomyces natalensis ATCC 27448]
MAAIDIQPLLAAGRIAHQQLMVDACTISRPGTPTLNRSTSVLTPGTPTVLYSGPCRLKPQRVPRNEEAGERLTVVARYELALPFASLAADDLHVGDTVTITASGDTRLVGQPFSVMAVDFGSTATAWRISVEGTT